MALTPLYNASDVVCTLLTHCRRSVVRDELRRDPQNFQVCSAFYLCNLRTFDIYWCRQGTPGPGFVDGCGIL